MLPLAADPLNGLESAPRQPAGDHRRSGRWHDSTAPDTSVQTDIQGKTVEALTQILDDRFTLLEEQQARQPADRSR
jgi:hypothetical protein